jgi:ABC-type lipoprotein release transport system permease subunit
LGAVTFAFRAELRQRWRSWIVVVVLISLVGGFVLATVSAGSRTDRAFPDFLASYGFDAQVFAVRPLPNIVNLHEVASGTAVIFAGNGQPKCDCGDAIDPAADFSVVVPSSRKISEYKLIAGRLPDPSAPNEVLASFTLQRDSGVGPGTVLHVPFYSRSQSGEAGSSVGAPPKPNGPTIAFRVVGIEATQTEFPSGTTPLYELYTTPAFRRSVLPKITSAHGYYVRLRHGAADIPRLTADVSALTSGAGGVESQTAQIASIEASIHPQAVGWWVLAALAALVGAVVVAQVLSRHTTVVAEAFPTMAALGADRRQLIWISMSRNLVFATAGAVGAVMLAVGLSSIGPLGEARLAHRSVGLSHDLASSVVGLPAVVIVVLALGIWPAIRASYVSQSKSRDLATRPSATVARLAALGAPPSALFGVNNAIQRKPGGASVPVGTALLGTSLAVIALCASMVFGASLSKLTSTPALYGDRFQLNFSENSTGAYSGLLRTLENDPAVVGISRGFGVNASINGIAVGGIAAKADRGPLLLSQANGHLPSKNGEIGLGVSTMRRLGVHVASEVRVAAYDPSGRKHTALFRVVSQISLPVLSGFVGLGTGLVLTIRGYEALVCPQGPGQVACRKAVGDNFNGGVLVSVVSGRRGQAAIDRYAKSYPSTTQFPVVPTSLVNFGEAVDFPLIFGGIVALSGAATLTHLLLVSVVRRRREIGLMKVLGFVNRQVASAVSWEATTVAVLGSLVGIPVGVIIGRAVWTLFANSLGVISVSVVPVALVATLVASVIVAANLLALLPALRAARYKPGQLLREL